MSQVKLVNESDMSMDKMLDERWDEKKFKEERAMSKERAIGHLGRIQRTDTERGDDGVGKKPNIIFCDIDGVLAEEGKTFYQINPEAIKNLKDLCDKSNSKVVICSTWVWQPTGKWISNPGDWRKHRSRLPKISDPLKDYLYEHQIEVDKFKDFDKVVFNEEGVATGIRVYDKKKNEEVIRKFRPAILKPLLIDRLLREHQDEINKYIVLGNPPKEEPNSSGKIPKRDDNFHAWNWGIQTGNGPEHKINDLYSRYGMRGHIVEVSDGYLTAQDVERALERLDSNRWGDDETAGKDYRSELAKQSGWAAAKKAFKEN